MKSGRALLLVFAVLMLASAAAFAGGSGTSSSSCGWAAVKWNAPAGAVVLTRAQGPVKAVIDAIGERRTHSMLSHGPDFGWASHSTMYSPGTTSWPTLCSTPVEPNDILNGYPGPSQINQGAIYKEVYDGGAPEFIYYQSGNGDGTNKGNAIQSYVWSSMPYQWTGSRQDSGAGLYRLKDDSGTPMNYVFYQYRDMGNANYGQSGWNHGLVCSTFLSYNQAKAGFGAISNSNTYYHATVVNALNGLYNAVSNSVGTWQNIGGGAACFDFNGIGDEAADQVVNCFARGVCNSSDGSYWHQYRDDPNSTARSISPDALGGWSGHTFGSAAPNPVWSYDGNNTVQWNSAGNVYGCWF